MSKRAHAKSNGGIDHLEGSSRHKRRREAHKSFSDAEIIKSNPSGSDGGPGVVLSKAEVRDIGTKIWQTVKDAVKDGRQLSVPFLTKPSKHDYPDYYLLIHSPIALDDIKRHLNKGKYSSLEDYKSDFELLFANAKQYNRPDSTIYEDAEYLLGLVHKTYNKLLPDDGAPDLYELLQERLDKLVSKSDPSDRLLSTEFMQLPSRKLWPFYYVEIKNPKCFDDINRNLRQKEYISSADFAADVELIFSNAMAFNQDGTQIFNDAVTLRDHFRRLMSDLPPPYTLPDYTKTTNKIRIRPVLATQNATPSTSRLIAGKQESTSLTLKVPPALPPAQAAAPSQAPTPSAGLSTSTLPVAPVTALRPPPVWAPAPKPSTSQAQPTKKSDTPQPSTTAQPVSFINANPSHYPRTQTPQIPVTAPAPTGVPTAVAPAPVLRASSVLNTTQTRPQTPAAPQVVYPLSRQLKSVDIQIQPSHRRLKLDHRDGVKFWSVRLVHGESSLLVNAVTYMEEEEDEISDDEHLDAEKEEDDDSMDVDHEVSPSKETRRKGKAKGRGRPPKTTLAAKAHAAAASAKAAKTARKVSRKPQDIQLKLNNFVVSEQPEKPGEWNVCLVAGSNVIEIGEAGGMIWKLYAERLAEV